MRVKVAYTEIFVHVMEFSLSEKDKGVLQNAKGYLQYMKNQYNTNNKWVSTFEEEVKLFSKNGDELVPYDITIKAAEIIAEFDGWYLKAFTNKGYLTTEKIEFE